MRFHLISFGKGFRLQHLVGSRPVITFRQFWQFCLKGVFNPSLSCQQSVFMDIMFPPSGILVVLMMQFLEVKTLSLSLHKWWISFKTTAHSQYIAGTSGHYKFWQNIWVNCCLEWRLISSDFFFSKNSEPEGWNWQIWQIFGFLNSMDGNLL